VVRYKDLKFHPAACPRRIAMHFCIDMNDDAVATAMRFVSRDAMRAMLDPTDTEVVMPSHDTRASAAFTQDDITFIGNTFASYLRHDFGYGRGDEPGWFE
jgi:hypothetical protein